MTEMQNLFHAKRDIKKRKNKNKGESRVLFALFLPYGNVWKRKKVCEDGKVCYTIEKFFLLRGFNAANEEVFT